jgi:hypothetical protein
MKIINLELIDTFMLSLEDVPHLSERERKSYAFMQCVRQVQKNDYCDYHTAYQIVEDSLTHLRVNYS